MATLRLRTNGIVTIVEPETPTDASAISTVRLALSGAVMIIDVTATDPIPSLEIYDIEAAAWWLLSLYGEDTADRTIGYALEAAEESDRQLAAGTDQPEVSSLQAEFDPRDGILNDPLRRLALAVWLHRWWPSGSARIPSLPVWLLDAEAGVLANRVELALDEEVGLVDHLLATHVEQIAANLADHQLRAEASFADTLVDATLLAAARSALDALSNGVSGITELDRIERAVTDSDEMMDHLRQELADEVSLSKFFRDAEQTVEQQFALVASGGDETPPDGTAMVDPRVVDARVFSDDERAISWWVVSSQGGVRCDIEIQLSNEKQETKTGKEIQFGEYFARIDYAGLMTVAPLTPRESLSRPGAKVLAGTAWLDATATHDALVISVFPLHAAEAAGGEITAPAPRSLRERLIDRDDIRHIVEQRMQQAHQHNEASTAPASWNAPFAAELSQHIQVPLR